MSALKVVLLLLACFQVAGCLGPISPNYVDERGAGNRTIALYATPYQVQSGGSCVQSNRGMALVHSTTSSADGKFSFNGLPSACYRVVDVTSRGRAPTTLAANDPLIAANSAAWIQRSPRQETLTGRSTVKDTGGIFAVRLCLPEGGHYNTLACR